MSWMQEIYVDTSLYFHRYKVIFNIKLICVSFLFYNIAFKELHYYKVCLSVTG